MAQPVLRCIELVDCITDWMEGELADEARLGVEEHLAICPHCTDYVEQIRLAAITMTEAHRIDAPPPSARAALMDAFRDQHPG